MVPLTLIRIYSVNYMILYGRPDEYFVLEDYADYARAQQEVDKAYKNKEKWAKKAIINVAKSGKFSSDRTIQQYADEIWNLKPLEIK